MNKKAQFGTAWFILAAIVAFFLLIWSGLGLWGLIKFITAGISPLGPVGIFFIVLILILILRRK